MPDRDCVSFPCRKDGWPKQYSATTGAGDPDICLSHNRVSNADEATRISSAFHAEFPIEDAGTELGPLCHRLFPSQLSRYNTLVKLFVVGDAAAFVLARSLLFGGVLLTFLSAPELNTQTTSCDPRSQLLQIADRYFFQDSIAC